MGKLLSSLAIGTTVKFGKHSVGTESALPIIWVVAAINRSGYPTGSVTLLAKEIIDLRAFDGKESGNENNKSGNNNYGLSNINQWLNSSASAGSWYSATHSYDTPPNDSNTGHGTGYQSRPGFLYNFAPSERNAILSTTVDSVTTKVFLPSGSEMGIFTTSNPLPYVSQFGGGTTITEQAVINTLSTSKPYDYKWDYWTRDDSGTKVYIVTSSGTYGARDAMYGSYGVRPLVNLAGSLEVSTVTDKDGCYTFSLTDAPSAPTNLQFSTSTIYTSKPCSVQWGASTDPNGDAFTYKIHLYYDGVESGVAIDVGTATSYTLASVRSGVSSVGFGVEAVDTRGHSSGIVTVSRAAYTNYAPTISGTNSDLGVKTTDFSQTYTISDADNNTVTVTEYIDNVMIRSYVATLGATNTLAVTGNTWLKLVNGIHTLKITATDGIDTSTRTFTFTKTVNTLVAQRTTPLTSTTKPTRLVVTVVKNIPPEAIFKVEACNNGFDTAPAWEDITSSVTKGQAHVFTNTVKTATNWGVNIRVTVNRNGGEGACYITEIGGNFE